MNAPTFVYSLAASLDGFIADAKGGVNWLNAYSDADYGLEEFFRSMDAVVMGRKTYEISLKLGAPPAGKARMIVLSKKLKKAKLGFEVWNRGLKELAQELASQGAKRVWMMGGGVAAASLLDAGLLDEVEIATIPVVLGAGVPMFAKTKKAVRFELATAKEFPNGVVLRNYRRADAAKKTKAAAVR